jgi:hypothetical protein
MRAATVLISSLCAAYIFAIYASRPFALHARNELGEGMPIKGLVFAFFFVSSFMFLITFGKWLVNRRHRSSRIQTESARMLRHGYAASGMAGSVIYVTLASRQMDYARGAADQAVERRNCSKKPPGKSRIGWSGM